MSIDIATLRCAITGILAEMESEHAGLTELDGKLGDGDLGVTLLKAFRALDQMKAGLPDDLGAAFLQAGSTVGKVSSSSFGTLFATSLIAVSKLTKGRTAVPLSEVSALLDAAVQAMSARGKAALGDKTVLDAVDAAARATAAEASPAAMQAAAAQAVAAALDLFRQKPNKIGRARIFADKTIGLDDPGMVAVKVMIDGLGKT